ncbi:MAG: NTP transferase domain-containing protein [Thaumarchaeota archaeon]|nr:NTP transferase domain-containing protein [Nitrososphaerota archaeon]
MKTHIYLQARIGSTRLPGKVLKKICNKSVLQLIIERLKLVKNIEKIVIVTGPEDVNSSIINDAKRLKVDYFCGNEQNILDRFYQAHLFLDSDVIIRVTGDCPLIDPDLINKGLEIFSRVHCDILSVNRVRTFPHGFDFEIFTGDALKRSWMEIHNTYTSNNDFYKSVIPPTTHMLNSQNFTNFDLVNDDNLSNIRLTLDYQEDFELIAKVYEILYKDGKYFGLTEIVSLLKERPELLKINEKYIIY